MKFRIDPAIFSYFPHLHIGVVSAKGVDNHGECPEILEKIGHVLREIRGRFDRKTLAEHPKIQAWRKAYASFGAKPKKHLSSVESLYRMALEGASLRSINKLVDTYNFISLKHMVPVGGDDLAKVEGNIELRFAVEDESFVPLGSGEVQKARNGEVVYADMKSILCRRWNWRESEKTKMTERTREVLLVSEGLPPVTAEEMKQIVEELALMVKEYCGGDVNEDVLGGHKNRWEF